VRSHSGPILQTFLQRENPAHKSAKRTVSRSPVPPAPAHGGGAFLFALSSAPASKLASLDCFNEIAVRAEDLDPLGIPSERGEVMIALPTSLRTVAVLMVEDEGAPILPIAASGAFDDAPSAQ